MNTQWIYKLALFTVFSGAITGYAQNQSTITIDNYPNKSIRLVVPFGPGSATDILARTIGEKLQLTLGQTVLIENRPGAGGTIASAQVARAEPDGYTLLVVSAGHVVNPVLYKNLSYDTLRDFRGVIPLANLPSALVVRGSAPQNNLTDLVNFVKKQPGDLNYVSGGIGSASHMNAEKFLLAANMKALHIPLKGAADMAIEIIAGRSQFGFMPLIAAIPFIKDGRLKVLAVSSSQRSSVLPNVPTIAEAGQPEGEFNFWIGLIAPSKTPLKIIQQLNQEISKIISEPELKERYLKLGAESMLLGPDKFDQFMESEMKVLGAAMMKANLKID